VDAIWKAASASSRHLVEHLFLQLALSASPMSTRKILSVLFIAAVLIALSACASDTSTAVTGPTKPVEPPSSTPPAPVAHDKGFIWSVEDGFKVIPTPSYAESMMLTGINNLGQVIGYVTLHDGLGDDRGFIWSSVDGLQLLGSLIGPDGISWPLSIDDNGEVRGRSEGPTIGGEILFGPYVADTFVWTSTTGMKPAAPDENLKPVSEGGKLLLPDGADCAQLVRATTAGLAIGYAGVLQNRECKPTTALMWDIDGRPITIDQCGTSSSCRTTLSDLNNRGEVIGYGKDGGFRWARSGGFVRIPVESGSLHSINDNGDVAGAVMTAVAGMSKPFVWMASGEMKIIDLPSGSTSGQAIGINNKNQIVGIFR
jgi:hypothetical protein